VSFEDAAIDRPLHRPDGRLGPKSLVLRKLGDVVSAFLVFREPAHDELAGVGFQGPFA
jgi:hypothetical protein